MENKFKPIIDYYEIYKNSVSFEQEELDIEIEKQIECELSKSENYGLIFQAELNKKFTRLLCEKAIMESAFLFAGAQSIKADNDFSYFSEMLLEEAKIDNEFSFKVRENLLIDSSYGYDAVHEIIDVNNISENAKLQQEILVQKRIVDFYTKLKSNHQNN